MTRLALPILVCLLVAIGFAPGTMPTAQAGTPEEMLADPALESRARDLSKQLRCLVCQNQSIDDSDAELARDLRVEVRRQLSTGASDAESWPASATPMATMCCSTRRSRREPGYCGAHLCW